MLIIKYQMWEWKLVQILYTNNSLHWHVFNFIYLFIIIVSGAGSSHGYPNPLDLKNREADATNGNLLNNIYTSIENINEPDYSEHTYDEINQKRINSMSPGKLTYS